MGGGGGGVWTILNVNKLFFYWHGVYKRWEGENIKTGIFLTRIKNVSLQCTILGKSMSFFLKSCEKKCSSRVVSSKNLY